jgi:opacity protein-like surface antigen
MRHSVSLAILMILSVSATSVLAAGAYLGAHAAFVEGSDVTDASTGYGLHAGLEFSTHWALELSGTLLEDESDAVDAAEFDLGTLSLSLLYRYPFAKIAQLHAGAGLSYNRFDFGGDTPLDIQDDDEIGFLLSIGASAELFDWLRLFADLGYHFVGYEINADGLESLDEDYNFMMVRLGGGIAL